MNRSPLRALLLIPFVLACFALSPQTRAVCQEGCDTVNANTFLGDNALLNTSPTPFASASQARRPRPISLALVGQLFWGIQL